MRIYLYNKFNNNTSYTTIYIICTTLGDRKKVRSTNVYIIFNPAPSDRVPEGAVPLHVCRSASRRRHFAVAQMHHRQNPYNNNNNNNACSTQSIHVFIIIYIYISVARQWTPIYNGFLGPVMTFFLENRRNKWPGNSDGLL